MTQLRSFLAFGATLLLFYPALSRASEDLPPISPELIARVAGSPGWKRLMHYHQGLPFGRIKSELQGKGFFFSPNGRTNPEAELRASAEAFAQDREVGELRQNPQCAFPERFRFIKRELHLTYHEVPCPLLDQYMAKFDADSVTLVFSGANQESPATMFGHTFLRLNSRKNGPAELLDQGLSYAAFVPPGDGPLVFYWLGMTGGYRGSFSMLPYYRKVNEYSNAESRDLWEYRLSLTREQTETLLRHAWEIETNSWMGYYFFDGNCAYALLALLEVARPDWELTPFSLYVIPGETVKQLSRIPGAISQVNFRPSLKRKLNSKIDRLSSPQKADFYSLIESRTAPKAISDPLVLDAAAAYFLFKKQQNDGKLSPEMLDQMRLVLSRRSEFHSEAAPDSANENELLSDGPSNRPDLGHDEIQIGLGLGSARYQGVPTLFQEFQIRSAYHDLLNDDQGFPRFSQIEFPSLALRYYPSPETFEIDRLNLLSIVSLFPLERIDRKMSWRLTLEYYSPKDYSCDSCHAFHFQAGPGLTTELFTPSVLGALFVLGDWEDGSRQGRWFRAGPGVQAMIIANPLTGYKTQIAETTLTDLGQDTRSRVRYEIEWDHSVKLATQWDARLSWSAILNDSGFRTYYDETRLLLNYYF
ncbi:MAG: DUF4105 domain-containing protein [Oligoflexia bacterium]|nr:DUF4105 domain-containing protein [Oligoflexia bacterium]